MSHKFSPLLSAKLLNGSPAQKEANIAKLHFPLLGSPKYDGWRIFEYNGEASTRSLKPKEPKNIHTRLKLREFYARVREDCGVTGLDGEVVVGSPCVPNTMQITTSGIGSFDGTPEIGYYIFDSYQHAHLPFQERWEKVRDCLLPTLVPGEFPWVHLVEQTTIHDLPQMWALLEEKLEMGFEGIMLRKPDAPYKMGRSSLNEGILIAVKKWETDEGEILEVREQLHNANEARVNALGHTERSGHRENLHGKNTMGSVLVRSRRFDDDFSVGGGPGLDAALRQYIWDHPDEFVGKKLTFRYQDVGIRTRPRFPQWMSVRDPADIS